MSPSAVPMLDVRAAAASAFATLCRPGSESSISAEPSGDSSVNREPAADLVDLGLELWIGDLAQRLLAYPTVLDDTLATYSPHKLCTYLFELAQAPFHSMGPSTSQSAKRKSMASPASR